jgi:tetratricopeptide (TPR) repeat protein
VSEAFVVEQGRRLSESMLWDLQRDRYNEGGIQAWARGNVPQTITTTPYIARAYARVVLGYLRDMAEQLVATQPVYIVELGAGSGRFGYRFVRRFADLLERSSLSHKRFKYLMTDVSPSIIEYWQQHPKLRPLVDAGLMDFALFDATHPTDLLPNSQNPLIVLGNYFFDSIPHDSFSIHDHQLFENLVRITSRRQAPELTLEDLDITFEAQPASSEYYPEPGVNRLLEEYCHRNENVMLQFPIGAIRCIRHFQALSDNRLLVIAGDIGSAHETDLGEHTAGGIGADNHFWLEVNFHALGEYVLELGGHVFHPPYRHASLNISAFVLGRPPSASNGFRETPLAYHEAIAQNGPDDFFLTSRVIAGRYEAMSRGELLAFLRSTGWDSDYFLECMPYLMDSLVEVSWSGRQDVLHGVDEAWQAYYPMGHGADAGDLPFSFGVLLYTIGEYSPALEYFLRSLELFGADARTTFNVALCQYRLERPAEALHWIDRTLELDPHADQAREMRASIMEAP